MWLMAVKAKVSLTTKVFIGLILGIAVGLLVPKVGLMLKPVGDVFVNLIKMVIVPLIITAIVSAVASLRDIQTVGKVGVIALVITAVLNFVGAFYGLMVGFITNPAKGVVLTTVSEVPKAAEPISAIDILTGIVPTNIFASLSKGDVLPIIFFCIMLGLAIVALGKRASILEEIFTIGREAMIIITEWIMKVAPYGVFSLVGRTVASQGAEVLLPLLRLVLIIYAAFLVWLLVVQTILVKFVLRLNVPGFYRALSEVIAIGFTTCSSAATTPINMKHTHERLGVSRPVADFVVGLATTTTGRAGACIYNGICIMFVAGLVGVQVTFSEMIMASVLLMLIWLGGSGIPGGGTVMLTIVLQAVGLPVEPVSLLFGIDRLRDMPTTFVNVVLQATTAAMAAVFMGEKLKLEVPSGKGDYTTA